MFKQVSN